MSYFATKEQLELLTSRLETATYILTFLAGVAGISFLAFNRKLEKFTKAELLVFQKQIAETNALSEAAKADAATARTQEEQSRSERVSLEIKLKEMEQSHSKLAATSAETEQKLLKLQEGNKPRTVTPAQRLIIVNLLKPFSGQKVSVNIYGMESETQIFSQQIVTTLQEAGLQVNASNVLGSVAQGLGILVHSQQNVPPLAGTVQHAFAAAGLPMIGAVRPDVVQAPADFIIMVGGKFPQ